jgi:hypothetical protein
MGLGGVNSKAHDLVQGRARRTSGGLRLGETIEQPEAWKSRVDATGEGEFVLGLDAEPRPSATRTYPLRLLREVNNSWLADPGLATPQEHSAAPNLRTIEQLDLLVLLGVSPQ